MAPNTNTETGIRFGIISANSVSADVLDNIWNYGINRSEETLKEDLRMEIEAEANREADALEEEALIAIAETDPGLVGNEAWEERSIEDAYLRAGYDGREDFLAYKLDRAIDDSPAIEEPTIEFEIEGVKGVTTWLGGGLLLCIFKSPWVTRAKICSPCVPNCGDLDSIAVDGFECYDVPPNWRI